MFQSIHLTNFPNVDFISNDNDKIIKSMDIIREICSIVLSIRKNNNIKVKIPLNNITICAKYSNVIETFSHIIKEEINCRNIIYVSQNFSELANENVVINMQKCGKEFGSKLKDILFAQKNKQFHIIHNQNNETILKISDLELNNDYFTINYIPKDSSNQIKLSKNGQILVLIDTTVNDDQKLEGISKEIIRFIQQMRKNQNLIINQRINVEIITNNQDIFNAINSQFNNIKEQTLSMILEYKLTNNFNNNIAESYTMDKDNEFGIKILIA